ncbi:hypothetical protein AAFF_G00271130 [Aldrovandia affinis]|uniref:Uncharacterized protein n=1 Tax=Aldrovandia affinis TaxID=143900 RepID=A0AAD7RAU2_9TELE|nr:hypothetical protein AAFF_G00271130 [Aldrovandia affinis]
MFEVPLGSHPGPMLRLCWLMFQGTRLGGDDSPDRIHTDGNPWISRRKAPGGATQSHSPGELLPVPSDGPVIEGLTLSRTGFCISVARL